MEIQETLIAIIPLILVVALLVYAARGIAEGKGFKAVREIVPAAIVLLVAIAVIGAVSSAGGGDEPTDEGDVPVDMMIFDTSFETYAVLIGISEDYEIPDDGYRLVVPATYQSLPVAEIGTGEEPDWDAIEGGTYVPIFSGCIAVSSSSAETISDYAFSECTSLASASFPAATTIGSYAFWGCTSLASASFPAATTIGDYAFEMFESASKSVKAVSSAIESVTLGPLTNISGNAFPDWTFYDVDGATMLSKTAANLADSTFQGTASALVKLSSAEKRLTPDQQRAVEEITALMASMTEEERLQYEIAELEGMQARSEGEDLEWVNERIQELQTQELDMQPLPFQPAVQTNDMEVSA